MPELTNILYQACRVGDSQLVSSIMTPDYLKKVPQITKITMLRLAIEYTNIEFTKFLLTHFKSIDNKDESVVFACKTSISMNKLDILKTIIDNFPDDNYLNIDLQNCNLIGSAIRNEKIEAVKYLINTDILKSYPNYRKIKDSLFLSAYSEKQFDILKYFIFDLDIKLTSYIKHYIESDSSLIQMFELRELNKSLSKNLTSNEKDKHLTKNLKI
jgi:hypothetical protein